MSGFAYRKSYDLPRGFAVEFVLDGSHLECRWTPRPPVGRKARNILPHYREARNDFLAGLDITTLVVEL